MDHDGSLCHFNRIIASSQPGEEKETIPDSFHLSFRGLSPKFVWVHSRGEHWGFYDVLA
jgi:hypothetical protein